MPDIRITEKETASSVKAGASFLITQKETVGGSDVESLRRAPMAAVVDALHTAGLLPLYTVKWLSPPSEGQPYPAEDVARNTQIINTVRNLTPGTYILYGVIHDYAVPAFYVLRRTGPAVQFLVKDGEDDPGTFFEIGIANGTYKQSEAYAINVGTFDESSENAAGQRTIAEWIAAKTELYLVTVTMTSATTASMDKTIAEIDAAVSAGKSLIAKLVIPGTGYAYSQWCAYETDSSLRYGSFNVWAYYGGNTSVGAFYSGTTDDGSNTSGTVDGVFFVTDSEKATWDAKYNKPTGGIPKSDLSPDVQDSLDKANTALQTETDPTVPAWAKVATKPTYTKAEVGLGNVANVLQYSADNPPPYPVTSVNGQTGVVTVDVPEKISDLDNDLTASDIPNLPASKVTSGTFADARIASAATWNAKYAKPSGGIPKIDLASGVQASLDKADSALQSAPVSSVNGKTGAVSLSYSDVGADASGAAATVQGNLDSHTQDSTIHVTAANKTTWNAKYAKPSGGIPKSDLAEAVQTSLDRADTALQSAPVSSVNNKTGAVELTHSDVGADESGAAATVQWNLTSHANDTDIHTTANEKTAWNAKYSKPSGGIPKSDLSAGVQSSLNLADTALQAAPVSSVNGKTGAVKINRYGTVMLTTSWAQSGNWYTQTASLAGLGADDLVSIQLDDSTIEALIADGVTCLKCDNVNGTATFKALGAAPSAAITVQYELTVESASS